MQENPEKFKHLEVSSERDLHTLSPDCICKPYEAREGEYVIYAHRALEEKSNDDYFIEKCRETVKKWAEGKLINIREGFKVVEE